MMEIESAPKNADFLFPWISPPGTYFGNSGFSNSGQKSLFDNEIESRTSTIELKKQTQQISTSEQVLQAEPNTPEELIINVPLVDENEEEFKNLLINKYYVKETPAPQEVKLLQFYSDPEQYDPYTLRPRYNNSYTYIHEKNTNSENCLSYTQTFFSQEFLKFSEDKVDVGKQFLKIHMKKCMNYAMNSLVSIRDTLKVILFEENAVVFAFNRELQEKFLAQKTYEFQRWLLDLKVRFRYYGKQDFRDAYVANNIQTILIKMDHANALANNQGSRVLLEEVNTLMNENLMKETFRRMSLKFLVDKGPYGLMSELNQSCNIGVPVEHLKYIQVTKWLLEKPTRIDTADIHRKSWIDSVVKATAK